MSLVAVAQYCASNLILKNLKTCIELLEKASIGGAKVIIIYCTKDGFQILLLINLLMY